MPVPRRGGVKLTASRSSIPLGVLFLFLLPVGCGLSEFHRFHHRPDMAANSAVEFARAAFVEKDDGKAFKLLWDGGRQPVSREWLAESVRKMHPNGYPTEVKAIEYEPVPGQPAMSIYLRGTNGSEEFLYRLLLQGTSDTGYKVSDFFRGNGPYPTSPLRKPL